MASSFMIRQGRVFRTGNLAVLLALVFAPLILYPLGGLIWLSFHDKKGLSLLSYSQFFSNPESWNVIGTTAKILIASASIATVVGVVLAALLFYLPFRGSRTLVRFMELFVAFPSFLIAFTLIFLYGAQGSVNILLERSFALDHPPIDFLFGFGGVLLAQVIYYTPFVVRPTLTALTLIDERVVEAARSLGAGPLMVARRVVLPMALPGIVAGSILCFLLTMNEFGILLVLGSAKLITLPISIYSAATIDLDLQAASAQAVVMLAASLSVFMLYRRVTRSATRSHARA
ncbi:MAG TPA: 2-aminoethylphosphonate ABC transporter permease subunit [Alphaproteobacteria bacterium]|nr:2-aminoethylphosphonate ABC transporter permease subunit [Alphaproteobacteria bacterium]